MKEKINQANQSRETKYKNMSKPKLTSMQTRDDCGRPDADYVATCWIGQPAHHVELPRRFSSGDSASKYLVWI